MTSKYCHLCCWKVTWKIPRAALGDPLSGVTSSSASPWKLVPSLGECTELPDSPSSEHFFSHLSISLSRDCKKKTNQPTEKKPTHKQKWTKQAVIVALRCAPALGAPTSLNCPEEPRLGPLPGPAQWPRSCTEGHAPLLAPIWVMLGGSGLSFADSALLLYIFGVVTRHQL